MQLTNAESSIHESALRAGANLIRSEWPVIEALSKVDSRKLFKKLDQPSLFKYATKYLRLSDSAALTFISVARKSSEVAELRASIRFAKLSVWKAARLVAAINDENASELIDFATKSTDREIDFEVAKRNPKALPKDRVKVLSEEHVQVTTVMTVADFEKLKRVESLEAQKGNLGPLGRTIGVCAKTHLEKHDPVRKAERAKPRETLFKQSRKAPAGETHKVNLRDLGRCTHVDEDGRRCNSDRWVEHHHIKPYSCGGESRAENLTTLCSFHHKQLHEFRSPWIKYSRNETTSVYHYAGRENPPH